MLRNSNTSLYSLDDREEVLRSVKHHPVGIVPLIAGMALVVMAGVAAMFLVEPITSNVTFDVSRTAFILFMLGILALVALFTAVAVIVYFRSQLIITSESIIEINQRSLFHRDVSQLSLANVQEVTVKQSGIFSHLFDFGTVTLETAGEKANFKFSRAPHPHEVSRAIYQAHERFIETHPEFTSSQKT